MNVRIQSRLTSNNVNKCTYQFRYGDELIGFERVDRRSDARRILIKVYSDCRVVVQAPIGASDNDVMQAAKKRSRWIYKKLNGFRDQLLDIRPRQYISGESHYYLGRRYMLKVIVEPSCRSQVKLLRGKLEVTVKKQNSGEVKGMLNDWYKIRAKDVFKRRLNAVMDKTYWVKEIPSMRIFSMAKQWGSCSPNGRLTLNPYLVKAPKECIDYVILHELCHLVEHNHSEKFYRLVSRVMPDWKNNKTKLDNSAGVLLSE